MQNPRQRLKNWIGHLVPHDKQAAIDLTKVLADAAMANGPSRKVNMIALVRDRTTEYDYAREEGLRMQAQADYRVTLTVFLEDRKDENHWAGPWANKGIKDILRKQTDANVIWAIGDTGTYIATQSVERVGRKPGKDIFIGGFDWTPEILQDTEDGKVSASMLGHYLEGVWALILAHDYHYGFDFKDDVGARINTPLAAMTPENVAQYKKVLKKDFWDKVDFRKLSKKYNPALKSHNFNINQFLDLAKTSGNKL